jgi:hypothetical protein
VERAAFAPPPARRRTCDVIVFSEPCLSNVKLTIHKSME